MANVSSNLIVGAGAGNSNRIEIANGAQLIDENGMLAWHRNSRDCWATVADPGSSWINRNTLYVGGDGVRAGLMISNGGKVFSSKSYVGWSGISQGIGCGQIGSHSRVHIIGPQSLWQTDGELHLGTVGVGNSLIVTNGGTAAARSLFIGTTFGVWGGCSPVPDANQVTVAGGCMIVTNSLRDGNLDIRHGTLELRSRLVVTDWLVLTNGNLCRFDFQGGRLVLAHGLVRNGSPLLIGDGLHNSHVYLDNGDIAASDGVYVRQHALLSGHGEIIGHVTNSGTVWLSTANQTTWPATLQIQGHLQLEPSATLMVDIFGPTDTPFLLGNGSIVLNGSLRVRLRPGYVPSQTNVFTVLESPAIAGAFANVADGQRLRTVNNLGSFQVSYSSMGIVLDDFQSTDMDGDGIDDTWAMHYFGHSPLAETEKRADDDGDGATNRDEFLAGTDPTNSESVFEANISYASGVAVVEFPYLEGKLYRVWFSENLQTWQEIMNPTFEYQASQCRWIDDGKDTSGLGARSRFYRLSVE